jgi:hypothetical protein
MRKATATYVAPKGDSKVVEMGGVTFFDGKSVDLNTDDNSHLVLKLPGNPHFDVELGEEEASPAKKKVGRPSNADKAAAEKEAADKLAAERAAGKLNPAAQQAAQQAQTPLLSTGQT